MEPMYESILKQKRKIIAEIEQSIRDANYWNGLPQAAGHTLDIEPERIALHYARESLALWEAGKTVESAVPWEKVIGCCTGTGIPTGMV